jgi:hypothetical protein
MKPNKYRPRKDAPRSPIDGELMHDYADWLPTPLGIRAACEQIRAQRTGKQSTPEDKRPPLESRPHRLHVELRT